MRQHRRVIPEDGSSGSEDRLSGTHSVTSTPSDHTGGYAAKALPRAPNTADLFRNGSRIDARRFAPSAFRDDDLRFGPFARYQCLPPTEAAAPLLHPCRGKPNGPRLYAARSASVTVTSSVWAKPFE